MGKALDKYMESKGIKEKFNKNKADLLADLDKANTIAQLKNVLKKVLS